MQKIFIPILIFVAVMIALIFGEGLLRASFNFLENILIFLINYWKAFYYHIGLFIQQHPYKILLAVLITILASIWVFNKHGDELNEPANKRKIAILLALLLGWLGAHRFYLGQIGKGILYLILCFFFTPIAVLLGFIDAIRYAFTSDEAFRTKYRI